MKVSAEVQQLLELDRVERSEMGTKITLDLAGIRVTISADTKLNISVSKVGP